MTTAEEDEFRAAFADLFPAAYRLAWRIVGDVATAEDVAAEALARAYARWPKVRDLPHRTAWVLRVAANVAIDVVRRRPPPLAAPQLTDPSEEVTSRLALAAALRALPRKQRDAIVLRYLHGFREDEVARALGVAQGTVKTHLRRGLRSLRDRLGDAFKEDTVVI